MSVHGPFSFTASSSSLTFPILHFVITIIIIIIFDLDHSQATYRNDTAECVLATLSQH